MKRKTLTTAVLAGLTGVAGMAGVANAVNLNPDGLGQVLLYPYYSARGGNDTLFSVVNTTDQAKAVKIRFIEALNSREVLDFNIYMSEFDVWTGAISATESGGGKVATADRTCTVTQFNFNEDGVGEKSFVDFQYVGTNGDGGPTGIDRTASGYIEILEMGTMVGAHATAATHVDGVPNDCDFLTASWQAGAWAGDRHADIEPPSGGLFGGASIINVADGTMYSYNATAIDGWRVASPEHTDPGLLTPSLGGGDSFESNVFINGVIDTQSWPEPIDAVNAVLMHDTIVNEYVVGGGAAARSEWVLTFPTKRFHTDSAPGGPNPGQPTKQPFTSLWTVADPGACEAMDVTIWDREEGGVAPGGLVDSPQPPGAPPFALCAEANVIRWARESDGAAPDMAEITKEKLDGIFGYRNFVMPDRFTSGWARFNFGGQTSIPADSGDVYVGLPIIGFWVNTFTNGTLEIDGANVLSNYGGTFNHRGTRRVEEGS